MNIFLDMDGVITRFVLGAQKVHDQVGTEANQWDFFKNWGISSSEFWKKINKEPNFWKELEPYDHFQDLINLIEKYDPNYKILTSPFNSPECYSGKYIWLKKHLGLDCQKRAIFTGAKEFLAAPGRVLIDDNDLNCQKWSDHGGVAILFPQPWNMAYNIRNKLDFVEKCLDAYKNLLSEDEEIGE